MNYFYYFCKKYKGMIKYILILVSLILFTACLKRDPKVRTVKAYVYSMEYRHSYTSYTWVNKHMQTNYHPAKWYTTFTFNDS
jgi:hypothetical protein